MNNSHRVLKKSCLRLYFASIPPIFIVQLRKCNQKSLTAAELQKTKMMRIIVKAGAESFSFGSRIFSLEPMRLKCGDSLSPDVLDLNGQGIFQTPFSRERQTICLFDKDREVKIDREHIFSSIACAVKRTLRKLSSYAVAGYAVPQGLNAKS